jgi:ATP-binding cassette subfamily F protein uup
MIHLPDGNAIHINSYLDKFLFTSSEIRRPISTLSGGERNRLQLALFMKESADLWIFDEPTNDLDIETIETLENSLIEYKQAVIIVSHDRAFLDKVTTKSWILKNKTIEEFHGNYSDNADLLEEDQVETVKDAPTEIVKEKRTGISNKEKILLESIEKDIEKKEVIIEKLQSEASLFDFSSMDESRTLEYKKLESKITKSESDLDSLMLKWEELSQKV